MKREAPAHAKIQTEVIKMIASKKGIKYNIALKELKKTVEKAIGKPYVSGGDITWMDALKKTKQYLQSH
jgi:hypothetical protein